MHVERNNGTNVDLARIEDDYCSLPLIQVPSILAGEWYLFFQFQPTS